MEISILLLTYNHESYVRQALDSIIMQKINVSYEIIILDDASTDHTPNILREYKKKYPSKISLYLKKINHCHPTKNVYFLLSKARGRYYAFLEGDDYWIDDLKIQKQYDFLENHRQYSGCMTDLIVVDENNSEIEFSAFQKKENNIYVLEDLRNLRSTGMTVSFFAKNYFSKNKYRIIYKADRMMGDITNYMLCLLRGDIYQIDEKMAAYRYVSISGKSNFNSIHHENFYRDYIQVRYWLRLENYLCSIDKNNKIIPLLDIMRRITKEYPTKVVLNLIKQSENRKKYLLIFLIYKFLFTSDYLVENMKVRKNGKQYRLSAFSKKKIPIVLFGAGAVAVEYIDKYAWQDNILFLVDNDKKKQNTSFKGFMIKRPDEILKFKDKVKVLITIREHEATIETQLREMGITNYYCYCSMQSRRARNIIGKRLLGFAKGR